MVVVLSDWVGPAQLPRSLALTMVVLGLLISPGQFAIGYLSDVTNDYVWPMRVCFFMLILAGLLLLLEFPVRLYYSRRARRHYLSVSGINPLLASHDKLAMNGINGPHTVMSDCWQVVDSEEEDNAGLNNDAVVDDDDDNDSQDEEESSGLPNTTQMHLIQSGITPVPAHLALVDGAVPPSTLFVCSQEEHSDDWNDLEGV
ncbi:unnamed protein product [Echinostoma caproni]|uniref:MFS domain-containing protein n=1 Tax=Echinostoma caproni TaxID=27848 RepID=A0A183B6P6_9TREM|nr:unnamed protein product [Echinostoma caproni]